MGFGQEGAATALSPLPWCQGAGGKGWGKVWGRFGDERAVWDEGQEAWCYSRVCCLGQGDGTSSGGHQEHPPPRIPRGRWHHLLPAAVEPFYPNNKVWGRDAVDLTKS